MDHYIGHRNVLYLDMQTAMKRLESKLHDLAHDKESWLKLTAIIPWAQFQAIFKRIRVSVDSFRGRGKTYIGYWSDYKELTYALDALDSLGSEAGSQAKGDAYGRVFIAASKFFQFAPPPIDKYAKPLDAIGAVFGNIANAVSGDYKYTNKKYGNYTPLQLRRIMNGETTGDG